MVSQGMVRYQWRDARERRPVRRQVFLLLRLLRYHRPRAGDLLVEREKALCLRCEVSSARHFFFSNQSS